MDAQFPFAPFDEYADSGTELAQCEVELPEWDRLCVRDYWASVITEELGSRSPASAGEPGEYARLLRVARRSRSNVVALFPGVRSSGAAAGATGQAAA